jgi:hypothetical protein
VRKTAQRLLAEYGVAAVIVYFTIFFAVLFGAWALIRAGWQPSSAAGGVGTFTAAYLVTKVAQPLRIAATIALTPLVARAWDRLRGRPVTAEATAPAPPAPLAD